MEENVVLDQCFFCDHVEHIALHMNAHGIDVTGSQ